MYPGCGQQKMSGQNRKEEKSMKIIYEILYPFGAKEVQVEDDFETKFPHTEVAPDPNRDLMLQFWDQKRSIWRPVEYMANEEKLTLLENFYIYVKEENEEFSAKQTQMAELNATLMLNDLKLVKENTDLKEKADNLAQINSKTMLASIKNSAEIAVLKEKLNRDSENTEGGE